MTGAWVPPGKPLVGRSAWLPPTRACSARWIMANWGARRDARSRRTGGTPSACATRSTDGRTRSGSTVRARASVSTHSIPRRYGVGTPCHRATRESMSRVAPTPCPTTTAPSSSDATSVIAAPTGIAPSNASGSRPARSSTVRGNRTIPDEVGSGFTSVDHVRTGLPSVTRTTATSRMRSIPRTIPAARTARTAKSRSPLTAGTVAVRSGTSCPSTLALGRSVRERTASSAAIQMSSPSWTTSPRSRNRASNSPTCETRAGKRTDAFPNRRAARSAVASPEGVPRRASRARDARVPRSMPEPRVPRPGPPYRVPPGEGVSGDNGVSSVPRCNFGTREAWK